MQSKTWQACSHVAALLFKLEEIKRQGLPAVPEDVTCTGTLQQWYVPPKRDVQAASVKDISFPKAQYGKTPKVVSKRLDDSNFKPQATIGKAALENLLTQVSLAYPKSGLLHFFENKPQGVMIWKHQGCFQKHEMLRKCSVSQIMGYNQLQYPTAAMNGELGIRVQLKLHILITGDRVGIR